MKQVLIPVCHLDNGLGVPACAADARGALLVDEPVHTTCPVCLVKVGELLRTRRVRTV